MTTSHQGHPEDIPVPLIQLGMPGEDTHPIHTPLNMQGI